MIHPVLRRTTRFASLAAIALLVAAAPAWADLTLNPNNAGVPGLPAPTLTIDPGAVTVTPNALQGFAFNVSGSNGDNNLDDIGQFGGLLTQTPISRIIIDAGGNPGVGPDRIDYRNDDDFRNGDAGNQAQGFATSLDGLPGLNQNDNFATMFVGEITIPDLNGGAAYDVEFGTNRSDDPMQVYLDLDQDGAFEAPAGDAQGATPGVNERVVSRNCCGSQYNTVNIAPGTYNYMAVQLERGGGSAIEPTIDLMLDGLGRRTVSPGDPLQAGLFSYTAVAPSDFSTDTLVVSSNNGVVDIQALVSSVSFAGIDFDPGASFTIDSTASMGTPVDFAAVALDGANAIGSSGGPQVTLGNITETSPGSSLAVTGDGTFVLATANTYTGDTTIGTGTLVRLGDNASLGDEVGMTVVESGATLDIAGFRAGANGNELVQVEGTGVGGNGAIINSGGTQTGAFRRLTLTGDATLRADSRWDVRNNGGAAELDMGGFDITKVGGSELAIVSATISNPGNVNVNQGLFRIEASTVYDAPGKTITVGGATLDFWNTGATHTPDITLQGGAQLSANGGGGPTLSGTVSLGGNATITTNNNITISGLLTGGGDLQKNGGARLVLQNAANDFTGDITINAGTVSAPSQAALGSPTGQVTVRGGALEVDGAWDLDSKPVSLAGGAINSVNGDTTISIPLDVARSSGFGSETAGSTLTVNGPITLAVFGDLTFSGAGDTVVNVPFGNGGATLKFSDALTHYGFHINDDNLALDLNNNGGMMGGGQPNTFQSFNAWTTLTNGPGDRGLDFNDDNDFINSGAIGQVDNYSNLWLGMVHVDAANAGDWQFRNAGDDDRGGIWLDLDQDGVFESSTAGLGSDRGEQLSWEDGGTKTVTLTEGDYLIAFTHREGGGGSRADFRFQSPTMGAEEIVKPTEATQAGLFSAAVDPANGLIKNGAGTLTLNAANTYNGLTTINGGTLIATNNTSLGTTDGGTTVGDGATLALQGGINVGPEALTLGTDAGTGTLVNVGGANSFGGNVTLGGAEATIDNQAGTLNLGGSVDMALSNLTVTGAGNTTIQGAISGTNTSTGFFDPGLLGGHQAGNPDLGPNSGNLGLVLGPYGGRTNAEHWDDVIGNGNSTLVYTGQIFLDGPTTFVESVDDRTLLIIDGQTVLDNGTWNDTTHGTIDRPAGWYDVELRFSNGGGGYGPVGQDGWDFATTGFGFGMDVNGNDNEDEANFVFPEDPGDASLFRVGVAASPSDLIKAGSGTLTLAGDNTYIGTTDVQEGTLLIDGTTSGQGNFTVDPGATLGGSGTIGLAAGNSVTVAGGATLAPGDNGVGILGIEGDLLLEDGAVLDWELGAGTDNHDQVAFVGAPGDLTLNAWTLMLGDAGGGEPQPGDKFYLIAGFDELLGPNAWTIDGSQVPWDISALSIGVDAEGLFLTSAAEAIPEPSTLALAALGLLGLAFCARRRRKT